LHFGEIALESVWVVPDQVSNRIIFDATTSQLINSMLGAVEY
jgi:hypothetical protein